MAHRSIGLDIGAHAVRAMVVVPDQAGGWSIQAFDEEPRLDATGASRPLTEVLTSLDRKIGLRRGLLTVSASELNILVRYIGSIPLPPDRVKRLLRLELSQQVGAGAELAADAMTLPIAGDEIIHFCAMAQAAQVYELLADLKKARLRPHRLAFGAASLYNLTLPHSPVEGQDLALIIDIGHHSSRLLLFGDQRILACRQIPNGSQAFTEALKRNQGRPDGEAARAPQPRWGAGEPPRTPSEGSLEPVTSAAEVPEGHAAGSSSARTGSAERPLVGRPSPPSASTGFVRATPLPVASSTADYNLELVEPDEDFAPPLTRIADIPTPVMSDPRPVQPLPPTSSGEFGFEPTAASPASSGAITGLRPSVPVAGAGPVSSQIAGPGAPPDSRRKTTEDRFVIIDIEGSEDHPTTPGADDPTETGRSATGAGITNSADTGDRPSTPAAVPAWLDEEPAVSAAVSVRGQDPIPPPPVSSPASSPASATAVPTASAILAGTASGLLPAGVPAPGASTIAIANRSLGPELSRAAEAFYGQIASSLAWFKVQIRQNKLDITKVFLTGGGAALLGLDGYLQRRFNLPVTCWDPFKASIDGVPPEFPWEYATAAGLALSEAPGAIVLDLQPEGLVRAREWSQRLIWPYVAAALLVVAAFFQIWSWLSEQHAKTQSIAAYNHYIKEYNRLTTGLETLTHDRDTLTADLRAIASRIYAGRDLLYTVRALKEQAEDSSYLWVTQLKTVPNQSLAPSSTTASRGGFSGGGRLGNMLSPAGTPPGDAAPDYASAIDGGAIMLSGLVKFQAAPKKTELDLFFNTWKNAIASWHPREDPTPLFDAVHTTVTEYQILDPEKQLQGHFQFTVRFPFQPIQLVQVTDATHASAGVTAKARGARHDP